jgi:hypothetical protein
LRQAYDYWQDQPGNYVGPHPYWRTDTAGFGKITERGTLSFARHLLLPTTLSLAIDPLSHRDRIANDGSTNGDDGGFLAPSGHSLRGRNTQDGRVLIEA